ncbi:MAG: CBS domain-containing protein [Acidocella sp.]|jgi:CBS domain-containing protein|nr:CBS domain-containing protein [Acidocella sp.]
MTIRSLLKEKSHAVIAARPGMKISEVAILLAEKSIGAVMVIDEDGKLVGILSERDIVRSLARRPSDTVNLTAADLMTKNPVVTNPEVSIEQVMEIMTDGRFRHLPVMERGRVTGIVSIGDVVKAWIDQQAHEVHSLRTYVMGAA